MRKKGSPAAAGGQNVIFWPKSPVFREKGRVTRRWWWLTGGKITAPGGGARPFRRVAGDGGPR
jgi:hypothetical protein